MDVGVTVLAAIPLLLVTGALSRSELGVIVDFLPLARRKAYASN